MADSPPTEEWKTRKPDESDVDFTLRYNSVGVDNFKERLDDLIDTGRDYGRLASRLKQRLATYEELASAIEGKGYVDGMQALPWKVEARIVSPLKIVLTGPGLDDSVEVEAEDEAEVNYILGESFFKTLAEHCEFFIEQEAEMLAVARLESAKAKLPPNVSAQSIVQNHIQLLKEYNEIKDIGQQLIGLIAENRGVTIGTLYENGDYGVTADD